jgi:hypothetical protein
MQIMEGDIIRTSLWYLPCHAFAGRGGVLVLLITDVVSTAANYNVAREIFSRNVTWDSLLSMEHFEPTRKSEATRLYSLKRLNARL